MICKWQVSTITINKLHEQLLFNEKLLHESMCHELEFGNDI
jgi:hypothetical protein